MKKITYLICCISAFFLVCANNLHAQPALFTNPENGEYCQGQTGVQMLIENTVPGQTYWLRRQGTTGNLSELVGNGGTVAFPGNQTVPGTYFTVPATNEVTVVLNPRPANQNIVAGNNGFYCDYPGTPGVPISIQGSQNGVEYSLYKAPADDFLTSWTGDGSSHTFGNYSEAGSYYVIAEYPLTGCSRHLGSVTLTPLSIPTANFATSAQNLCANEPVGFTDLSTTNEPGADIVAWQWDFDDPDSGSNNTSDQQNPNHVFEAWGNQFETFNVTLTATDSNGCYHSVSQNVTVEQKPHALITASGPGIQTSIIDGVTTFAYCGFQTFGLFRFTNASSTQSSNTHYHIDFGDGNEWDNSTFDSEIEHTYVGQGNKVLTYTVTGDNGCVNEVIYNIYVGSTPGGGLQLPHNLWSATPFTVKFPIQNQTYFNTPGTQYIIDFGDGSPLLTFSQSQLGSFNDTITHTYHNPSTELTFCQGQGDIYAYSVDITITNPCFTNNPTLCPIYVEQEAQGGFGVGGGSWGWGGGGWGGWGGGNWWGGGGGWWGGGTGGGGWGGFWGGTDDVLVACNPVSFADTTAAGFYITGGGAGYIDTATYLWDFGDGTTSTETFPEHTYADENTWYTVTLETFTGNDDENNSGINVTTKELFIQPSPVASFSLDDDLTDACVPKIVQVTDGSYHGDFGIPHYYWEVDPPVGWEIITPGHPGDNTHPDPIFQFNASGTYSITLTFLNTCGLDSFSREILVCQPPLVGFSAGTTHYCGVGERTLFPQYQDNCNPETVSYTWDITGVASVTFVDGTSNTSDFPVVNFPQTGTYQVAVTITNQCGSATANTTVVITDIIENNTISAAEDNFCSGYTGSFTIDGELPTGGVSGYTYQWEKFSDSDLVWTTIPGVTTQDLLVMEPLTETTEYRRRVNDSGSCSDTSDPITITVHPQISNNIISDNQVICIGNAAEPLTGTTPEGSQDPFSFQWYSSTDGGANYVPIAGAVSDTYNPGTITQTTYFRRAAISLPCDPDYSSPVMIEVCEPLSNNQIITTDQDICPGTTPNLLTGSTPDGSCGDFTYRWQYKTDSMTDFEDISFENSKDFQPPDLSVNTQYRRIIESSICSNDISNIVSINMLPVPDANAGEDQTIFNGHSTTLNGEASGGTPPHVSWEWQPAALIDGDNNLQNVTTMPLDTETEFMLYVTDENGCIGADMMVVNITGTPLQADISITAPGIDEICEGEPLEICAVVSGGNPNNYDYNWTSSPAGFNSNDLCIDVNPLVTTDYIFSLTDGSSNVQESITITVNPGPVITSGISSEVCHGSFLNYEPIPDISGSSFNWSSVTTGNCGGNTSNFTGATTIEDQLFNTGNEVCTVIYTITPYGPSPTFCQGTEFFFTAYVAPVASITNPVLQQAVISGQPSQEVIFTSNVADAEFAWSFTGTDCPPGLIDGHIDSGTGPIPQQTLSILAGGPPQCTVSYEVIPSFTMDGGTVCQGTTSTYQYIINLEPQEFDLICPAPICQGNQAVIVLEGSEAGVEYLLYRGSTPLPPAQPGTGGQLDWSDISTSGIYRIRALNLANQQATWMPGQCNVIINPLPKIFELKAINNETCLPATPQLSGSEANVNYYLMLDGNIEVQILPGTGNAGEFLVFNPVNMEGEYTVLAKNINTGCERWMEGSINLNPSPIEYDIYPGGILCEGVTLCIDGWQDGVEYQLYKNGVPYGPYVTGTPGETGLCFQTTDGPGIYTVYARFINTLCDVYFSEEVEIHEIPDIYSVSPPRGCPGTEIILQGCEPGIEYTLWFDPPAKSDHMDKGELITITCVSPSQTINFGEQWVEGYYSVKAVNPETNCVSWMEGQTIIKQAPEVYTMAPQGAGCGPVEITLNNSEEDVLYKLLRNGEWEPQYDVIGQPGGGPISFGEITTIGTYTIAAFYDHGSGLECSNIMNGSYEIKTFPTSYNLIPSSGIHCECVNPELASSQEGIDYYLENLTTGVVSGPFTASNGDPVLFDQVCEPGEYQAYAIDPDYPSCIKWMPGSFEIGLIPQAFDLFGPSPPQYCQLESGVRLTLDESQTGVSYQLYKNNGIVVGDQKIGSNGVALTWDDITEGSYYVVASSIANPECTTIMNNIIEVEELPAPVDYYLDIKQPGNNCLPLTPILDNSQSQATYELIRTVGTTSTTVDVKQGTGSPLTFVEINEPGIYTVLARIEYGANYCERLMNGSIEAIQAPKEFDFIVQGELCEDIAELWLAGSEPNTEYRLYLNGNQTGMIEIGDDDGESISLGVLEWPGTYTVQAKNLNTQCQIFFKESLTVSAKPQKFAVTPTEGCKGDEIFVNNCQPGIEYYLYLETFTKEGKENVLIAGPVSCTFAGEISFGHQHIAGTYHVLAVNPENNCSAWMNNTSTIWAVPDAFDMSPLDQGCPVQTFNLENSQSGVMYYLYHNDHNLLASAPGTGQKITFPGEYSQAGTYTVKGKKEHPSGHVCWTDMNGSFEMLSVPEVLTLKPTQPQCPPAAFTITDTEAGVSYTLHGDQSGAVETLTGNGNTIEFGAVTAPGNYHVTANNGQCTIIMAGIRTVLPPPVAYDIEPSGSWCTGDFIEIGLSDSDAGVIYELHRLPSSTNPQATFTGTGSAFTFTGTFTTSGTYKVKAINDDVHGCHSWMNGQIIMHKPPNLYDVTVNGDPADGFFCPGVEIGLFGSETGVNYELFYNDTSIDLKPGTGLPISFGTHSLPGDYRIEAKNPTTTCDTDMNGIIRLYDAPEIYSLNPSASTIYCFGDANAIDLVLEFSETGVDYQMYKEDLPNPVPVFPPKQGNENSLTWTNVSEEGPGNYFVEASFVNDPTCSAIMDGVITLEEVPLPTANLAGSTSICTGDSTTIEFELTGYQDLSLKLVYSANNILQDEVIFTEPPYIISVSPTITTTYDIISIEYNDYPFCTGTIISGTFLVEVLPLPEVTFTINDQTLTENNTYNFCHNEPVSVILTDIVHGDEPLNITWRFVNTGPVTNLSMKPGDALFDGVLDSGSHIFEIISITDVNSCKAVDYEPYTATIHIYEELFAGTASASQTICYGETPEPINAAEPTGGSSNFVYQWQKLNGADWYDIPGENNLTFHPPELFETTTYRLMQTDINCDPVQVVTTNEVEITVLDELIAGAVSSNQEVCHGEAPQPISASTPTGGSGSYLYQWQQWNGTQWNDIVSAVTLTYSPGNLTSTKLYRLRQTDTYCGPPQVVNTATVTITVYDQLIAGTVSDHQTICYDQVPDLIIANEPDGGSGIFEYQWQQWGGINWQPMAGQVSLTLQPPALIETTSYRLLQTDTYCQPEQVVATATVTITVHDELVAGDVIAGHGQVICYSETPLLPISFDEPAGGSGDYNYQWQELTGTGWVNIPGEDELEFQPPQLFETTTYRLMQSDVYCNPPQQVQTAEVTVSVHNELIAGVAGSDQTICYGETPEPLEALAPSGGSGGFDYQWQVLNGTIWEPVSLGTGTNTLIFSPPALYETTTYRLQQTDNYCDPPQDVFTNPVVITVDPLPVANAGPDATICELGFYVLTDASATYYDSILWEIIEGTGEIIQDTILKPTYTHFPAANGVVNNTILQMTVYGENACAAYASTSTMTVYVDPLPIADAGTGGQVCFNEEFQLDDAQAFHFDEVHWDVISGQGSIESPGDVNTFYVPGGNDAGKTVVLRLTAYGDGMCDDFIDQSLVTIDVLELPLLEFAINDETLLPGITYEYCFEEEIELSLSAISSGEPPFEVEWAVGSNAGTTSLSSLDDNLFSGVLIPGTHTLQILSIVDDNGCVPLEALPLNATIIIFEDLLPGILAPTSQTICYGETPEEITAFVPPSGGDETYSYQWQFRMDDGSGSWTAWADVLIGGNQVSYQPWNLVSTTQYRLIVNDGHNCGPVASDPVTIAVYDILTVDIDTDQTICYDTAPEELTSVISGGEGTHSYQWQYRKAFGAGGWTAWSNVIAGGNDANYEPGTLTKTTQYRLIVDDADGCGPVTSDPVTITVYEELTVSIATNQVICYDTAPEELTSQVNGGQGTYFHEWQYREADGTGGWTTWSNVPIGGTEANYQPGDLTITTQYQLIIDDEGSCGPVTSVSLSITVHDELVAGDVIAGNGQVICYSETPLPISFNEPDGGSGDYNYQWQKLTGTGWEDIPGGDELAFQPPQLFETTTYRLLQTDGYCDPVQQVETAEVTVIVYDELIAGVASSDQTICYGETPEPLEALAPSGGSGGFDYQWQVLNGTIWEPVSLGTGTNTLIFSPPALYETTTYRLQQTDNYCDPSQEVITNEVVITVYDELIAGTAGNDQEICYGEAPVPLNAAAPDGGSGNFSYQWQIWNGAGWDDIPAADDQTYQPPALFETTTYRLVQIDDHCDLPQLVETNEVVITVFEELTPGMAAADQAICIGDAPEPLSATEPSGGSGDYLYQWQHWSGTTWINTGSNSLNLVLPPLFTSTTYRLLQTDQHCSPQAQVSTNEVQVKIGAQPLAMFRTINNLNDSTACEQSHTYFEDLTSYGPYTPHPEQEISQRAWKVNGNIASFEYVGHNIVRYVFDEAGTHDVSLTVTSTLNGVEMDCASTYEQMITIHPLPIADFDYRKLDHCTRKTEFWSIPPSQLVHNWRWRFPGGFYNDAPNPVFNFPNSGNHDVMLAVSTIYGCTNDTTKTVFVEPAFDFSLNYDHFCFGDTTRIYVADIVPENNEIRQYTWYFSHSNEYQYGAEAVQVYDKPGVFNVSLAAVDESGCEKTKTIAVDVPAPPNAEFLVYQECEMEVVLYYDPGPSIASLTWDFGDGSDPVVFIQPDNEGGYYTYIYDDRKLYMVTLRVADINGCESIFYDNVRTICVEDMVFLVPNALAPDDTNDDVKAFLPKGRNIISYHLQIFDLKGNLIWESTELEEDTPAEAWDGTFKGNPLPQGIYIWKANVVFSNGKVWRGQNGDGITSGTVTIIR